jgi:hypothetical protein
MYNNARDWTVGYILHNIKRSCWVVKGKNEVRVSSDFTNSLPPLSKIWGPLLAILLVFCLTPMTALAMDINDWSAYTLNCRKIYPEARNQQLWVPNCIA